MKTRNAGLCDVFSDVAVVLFAGGGDRHDTFDKAASLGTVGAKTPFAPKHTRPHAAFGRIVRRFDARNAHKSPEVFGAFENPFARALHFMMATLRPLAQKPLDICTQSPHVLPERTAFQRPIAHAMPPVKHLVCFGQQRFADFTGLSRVFAKGREIAAQVRPAPLPKAMVEVVSTPPVRHQNPAESTEKLARRNLPALGVDHEHRGGTRYGHPQPRLRVGLAPPCLIGVQYLRRLRRFPRLVHGLGQRRTDGRLAGRDGTQADRDMEKVRQDTFHGTFAQAVDTAQQRDGGLKPRTESARGDAFGQRRPREFTAIVTPKSVQLILLDIRLERGNLPNLMTFRLRIFTIEFSTAVCASAGLDASDLVYFTTGNSSR